MAFLVFLLVLHICCLYLHVTTGCVLPPSDTSGRNHISVYTYGDFHYTDLRLYNVPISESFLAFKLKACADAFIALSPNPSIDKAYHYQIIIGGWGNSKSTITNSKSAAETNYRGVLLNCYLYKSFWISWSKGYIKVGRGEEVGEDVFMQQKNDRWNDTQEVQYVGCASHWSNHGDWIFNFAYSNRSFVEENVCSIDLKKDENNWCWPLNPCHNGAKCIANATSYNCYCDSKSFYGAHCEREYIICPLKPCQNGGTCRYDISGHSVCECTDKYTGDLCNIEKKLVPHWKELFNKHHSWQGFYYYSDIKYSFTLVLQMVAHGTENIILATFKENNKTIKMRGFSRDDVLITFELNLYSRANSVDFELSGILINHPNDDKWEYRGKITRPENSKYKAFKVYSVSETIEPKKASQIKPDGLSTKSVDDSDKKVALIMGPGIGFGSLFVTSGVVFIVFRNRKGHVRHQNNPSFSTDFNHLEETDSLDFA